MKFTLPLFLLLTSFVLKCDRKLQEVERELLALCGEMKQLESKDDKVTADCSASIISSVSKPNCIGPTVFPLIEAGSLIQGGRLTAFDLIEARV